jgi:hypothetical protein
VSIRTSRPHHPSRCSPGRARRVTAWSGRSLRRSNRHVPRISTATHGLPGLVRIASIQRHRPWCVSLCIAQSFGAVRRRTRNNVGPVTTVPSRFVGPMRKRAAGAFRKSHVPRPPRPRMRSAPQALDSHPLRSTCPSLRASRFVPGCGRRSQAPSVIPRSSIASGPVSDVQSGRWMEGLNLEAVTPLSVPG